MEPVGKGSLGVDVIAAIAKVKTNFKHDQLRPFDGRELNDPHVGSRGAHFYEADVGQARPEDPRERGVRRLVMKVLADRITEMYFSDSHYKKGSWRKITDF